MIPTISLSVDLPSLQTNVLLTAARGDAPDAAAEQELSVLLHVTLQGLRDPDPERRRSWALVLRKVGGMLSEAGDVLYSRPGSPPPGETAGPSGPRRSTTNATRPGPNSSAASNPIYP